MEGHIERTIRVNGQLMDLSTPKVMGILNVTPDSFYAGSRKETTSDIVNRVEQIITEGADMIDIGAYSSRSNAEHVSTKEEMARLRKGLEAIREVAPEAIVSVDTFRADVASMCVEEYGVALINDISGGQMDERMFDTVARLDVPYIMMHMQGTPQDMQQHIHYDHLRMEIMQYFALKVQDLHSRGVKDIIIDPGFGFGKTLAHNYELFKHLEDFKLFELPLLVGISRKSMIYKLLDSSPEEALNGTTVLNTIALTKGVDILRVHDVKACVEAVRIFNQMNEQKKKHFHAIRIRTERLYRHLPCRTDAVLLLQGHERVAFTERILRRADFRRILVVCLPNTGNETFGFHSRQTGQRRYTGTDYPVPRRNPQLLFHDRYTPASGKSPQTHPAQQERQ